MRILVIGGGGREHALVWKIAQSPRVEAVYCAPGNAGIAALAECVPIKPTDLDALTAFAESRKVDLTVVGPEAPLIAGIAERFRARGLAVFGPESGPARLEGSKTFAKRLMQAAGIPTAAFWTCESLAEGRACLRAYFAEHGPEAGVVLKADGLAAGKGVIVTEGEANAQAALERIMGERIFGAAGDSVVVEERLFGEEASIMAITDGEIILPLLPSQDHKRAYDGDQGPNTGGMGAYAPVPLLNPALAAQAIETILKPAIAAIGREGVPYRGALYAGVMLTAQGIKTIEFNCRLGDPETQAVLPLLESDLVPLLLGAAEGRLDAGLARWRQGASVCVVAASGGYPGDYVTGKPITGLESASADGLVFHAGTRLADGQIVTDGGRVLSVTGLGGSVPEAARRAYAGIEAIQFDGMHYRHDIAARARDEQSA